MPGERRWLRTVAVLAVGAVLVVAQLYLTVPLLPGVVERYGVPLSTATWVGGGFGLAFAVGNLVFGTASDRFDRRHVMATGLIACAAACLLAGSADSFAVLLAVRVLQGFVAAAFPSVALAHAAEAVPPHRRAVAVTAVSSSFLLAGLVGQAYALGVDRALGWRWVFWLVVPLLAALAVAVLRLPGTGARRSDLRATYAALFTLVRRPPLLVAYAGAITLLLTFVGMYTAFNAVVAQRYGITSAGALLLLRLPGLPGIVLGAFAGPVITRFGAHRVATVALATAAAGLLMEALATGLWGLLAGSAVFVAGLAAAVPSLVAVVGQASGEARGAGLAGYGFLVGVGGGIGPLLAPMPFTALCALLCAVLLAAAATLGLGPRQHAGRSAGQPAGQRVGA